MKTAIFSSLIAASAASFASAAVLNLGAGATAVYDGGSSSVVVTAVPNWGADVGEFYSWGRSYVIPVLLPASLPSGEQFSDADFHVRFHSFFGGNAPDYGVDVYGLSRTAATDTVLASDHYAGPVDSAATLVQNNMLTPTVVGGADNYTDATGDAALAGWLNTVWAGGANAGKYAFLRLTPDRTDGTYAWSGYTLITVLGGGTEERPSLTYSTAAMPEPASLSALALLAVSVLRRRR